MIRILGRTIVAQIKNLSSDDTELLTPWVESEGGALNSTFEVTAIGGPSPKVVGDVLHKNAAETGDGSAATVDSGTNARTSAGTSTFRCTGLKSMVRYRVKLTQDQLPTSDGIQYAHVRILRRVWERSGISPVPLES